MKFIILLGLLLSCNASLYKNGVLQWLLNSQYFIKCDHNRTMKLDVSEINVFFYDFPKNETQMFPIYNASKGILSIPDLIKVKQFFIFVGGYKSHINKNTQEQIRNAFRSYPNSYLIIIDHYPYTNNKHGIVKSYERAVKYVYYIGNALGKMLIGLMKGGISPKSMHCIGHSLGSQILGNAGETFFNRTGAKISRITALDPAGPCFSGSDIKEQVRSGVAEYVEIYHCNAGALGTTSVLGDVDYFLNNDGETQPNCSTPWIPSIFELTKTARCNHRVCVDFWTASVKNPCMFVAIKCKSYSSFRRGLCSDNDVVTAGFWTPGNTTGVYFISTVNKTQHTSLLNKLHHSVKKVACDTLTFISMG